MNVSSTKRIVPLGCLLACWALGARPASARERELLSEKPAVILDLQGESLLQLHHIRGTLSIRAGRPGELRYMARALDGSREEREVALWVEGRTLQLEPMPGREEEALLLEIAASPEMAASIVLDNGKLIVGGLEGGVEVHGKKLDVKSSGLLGSAELDIEGGEVQVYGAAEDVSVYGRDLKLTLIDIGGFVSVRATASRGEIQQVRNGCDIDLVDSQITLSSVQGQSVRIEASGGSVGLSDFSGAQISLDDTRLTLSNGRGVIEVDTNADVEFSELEGPLTVRGSYGGAVRGSGSRGPVEIQTAGAEVQLEKMMSSTRVSGDELRLRLSEIGGELNVNTHASTLDLERLDGAAIVENDFGDVVVTRATGKLKITNREGNVTIKALAAPLDLTAEGDEVQVYWTQITDEGSSVVNERGDVRLVLPQGAACRVEAEARGAIQSTIPDIRVSDDEHHAAGNLGRRNRPTIQVKSEGDIYLEPFRLGKLRERGPDADQ